MNNVQKNTLKKILEVEELTISGLADVVEVNRGALSQLLNHNKQLTESNWDRLKESYPEHVCEKSNKERAAELLAAKKKSVVPAKKVEVKTAPVKKEMDEDRETFSDIKESPLKTHIAKRIYHEVLKPEMEKIMNADKSVDKEIKTAEAERHRNLNCPESNYHMKVKYKDLLRGRPLCPLTQLPMMLKEELREYKKLDEDGKKVFIKSLTNNINLLKN